MIENTLPRQKLRLAINGFGRIGRNVLRVLLQKWQYLNSHIELVAINDMAPASTLLHLLKYDSTYGRLSQMGVTSDIYTTQHAVTGEEQYFLSITKKEGNFAQTSHHISLLHQASPEKLPWQELQIDLVLECTGQFRSYQDANRHRQAGAKQVIIGAAPFDEVDACIVMGVNGHQLHRQLPIISSVSCTTQALVPLLYTLDNAFGIKSVMMTEIHAVTADQNVLDQVHRDLRRARAANYNIIPTTSSSIAATQKVLPNMKNKINGHSIRIPTIDVAAIDVNFLFQQTVTTTQINDCLKFHSENDLNHIMGYTDEPLVSSDFIYQPESLVIDAEQTMQIGEQYKVFAWYDNEWGYANRLVEMCLKLAH